MGVNSQIRVLVADCHHLIREGLAHLLSRETDMQVVGDASNAEKAMALYREHQPDVALMDLRMTHKSAVEAIQTLRNEYPDARIIVLATFPEDEEIFPALRVGALDCLLKDMPRDQMFGVIRAVYAGERPSYFLQHQSHEEF